MDDVEKIKEITDDLCKLVSQSVNGILEKNFSEDPRNYLNTLFLKRYYYSLKTISQIFDRYKEDKFFHFPICLILRTNLLDFLIQCRILILMGENPNNLHGLKSLLADHFSNLRKDKNKFNEIESKLKELFPEFINEKSGNLVDGELSAYKIYSFIKDDPQFKEDSLAYDIYDVFSKIEHFGAISFILQDEDNDEMLFDRIVEAIKHVRFGIENSLLNLDIRADFDMIDEKIMKLRDDRFS